MRLLLFNEGNLGSHVMGQGQLDAALRVGSAGVSDVEARFAGLTAMGRLANATATRRVPPFSHWGLDVPKLRWHLVQSLRARAALRGELRQWPADAVQIHSQSVAMAIPDVLWSLPVAISTDTSVEDWANMPAWRPEERFATLALTAARALERSVLTRARLVLAWSAWAQRSLERAAPQAHVVEHHPGIDLQRYVPTERQSRERPRLLFVGGRFAAKGGEDLLAALGERLGRDVELDLVTPAAVPERPGLRVHRLGPSDPALLQLQQQADVMCLPTRGDASPWAVLEAMACGTPVVSTDVGGIPDMLDHGRAGVIVAAGDRRALSEALWALLDDPGRQGELGLSARRHCEERFDARRQFKRLMKLLRESGAPA